MFHFKQPNSLVPLDSQQQFLVGSKMWGLCGFCFRIVLNDISTNSNLGFLDPVSLNHLLHWSSHACEAMGALHLGFVTRTMNCIYSSRSNLVTGEVTIETKRKIQQLEALNSMTVV